jgi:plasmid stabilization system protein ParE
MAKEIRWSQESIGAFSKIIKYLGEHWSQKEIEDLINATEIITKLISENPEMFRKGKRKNVREALVTPHNLMIYKIYKKRIDIITFWDTRKNPRKKRF